MEELDAILQQSELNTKSYEQMAGKPPDEDLFATTLTDACVPELRSKLELSSKEVSVGRWGGVCPLAMAGRCRCWVCRFDCDVVARGGMMLRHSLSMPIVLGKVPFARVLRSVGVDRPLSIGLLVELTAGRTQLTASGHLDRKRLAWGPKMESRGYQAGFSAPQALDEDRCY